ncbi:MAG: hypothetical protein ABW321_24885 [Polyangiales bacterium]
MWSRSRKHAVLVLCLLPALSLLSCAGGKTFLASRSSIEVSDGPLCGAGVDNHKTCKPEDFGEGHWEREQNFPSFTVSEYTGRLSIREIAQEIRAYYLGSIYYEGDVHSYCKRQYKSEVFWSDDKYPGDGTELQVYDVREMLEKRAIRPMTTRLRSELNSTSRYDVSGIANRFYEYMMDAMRERVDARVLWFVIRYPGGIPDMAHHQELRRCVNEANDHHGEIITGVAGYAMLKNDIDNTIADEGIVYRAISRATSGFDYTIDESLKRRLADQWREEVDRIAHVRLTRQDITATAWPMWVKYD